MRKTGRHRRRRERFSAVKKGDYNGQFGRLDAPLSRPSVIERKRTRRKLRCGEVEDA